jgi:hypothetical protein
MSRVRPGASGWEWRRPDKGADEGREMECARVAPEPRGALPNSDQNQGSTCKWCRIVYVNVRIAISNCDPVRGSMCK